MENMKEAFTGSIKKNLKVVGGVVLCAIVTK